MTERAGRFRADVEAQGDLTPEDRVMLDEACRLIAALDRFEDLIAGDLNVWASIDWPFEDSPARLVISSVVSERRQHVAELRQVVRVLAERKVDGPEATAGEGGSKKKGLDEIAARRARRTG